MADRRDSIRKRLGPSADAGTPPEKLNVPGIAPATVEHLIEVFGEGAGFSQLSPGPGFSMSECALSAMAAQHGRDQVLNYLVALAENQL